MTGKVSIKATWHSTRKNHRHLVKSSLYVVYTGPEIYFTAELNAGVHYICTMAVRSRTVLERVFAIYSGILNTSKPFKFICQRNLSQAQATDAKKLRAMVNVLYSYVAVSADHQVILAQLLSFWFLRQMSKLKYNQREFLKHWFIIKHNYLKMR